MKKNMTKGAPGRVDETIVPLGDVFADAKSGNDTVVYNPSAGSEGGHYKGALVSIRLNSTSR